MSWFIFVFVLLLVVGMGISQDVKVMIDEEETKGQETRQPREPL